MVKSFVRLKASKLNITAAHAVDQELVPIEPLYVCIWHSLDCSCNVFDLLTIDCHNAKWFFNFDLLMIPLPFYDWSNVSGTAGT